MKNISNIELRKLDLSGIRNMVERANEEGWNPCPYDAEAFWAADPNGFYGFFRDEEMVGCCSAVSYLGQYGFMGFFIVKPELRGNGIGRMLWGTCQEQLLGRLQKGAAVGIDGVVAMQPFYQRCGFDVAFRDLRFEFTGRSLITHPSITKIEKNDLPQIKETDRRCFGFDRSAFLERWIELPERFCFKYATDGGIQGFTVLRKVNSGYKLGPLFAYSTVAATALFEACLNAVPEDKLYLDIPLANHAAVTLANRFKGTFVFECARMYHGIQPVTQINNVFGITSFELG